MEARPDYGHWDHEDEFTLRAAAWLCCDWEPRQDTRDNLLPLRVYEMERRIIREGVPIADTTRRELRKGVFTRGLFREPELYERVIPGVRYVTRKALLEWCEQTGRQPPFLYPEERQGAAPSAPEEVSGREEAAVLKILAAVLVKAYKKDNIIADLKQDKSTMFGCVYRDVTSRYPMNEKTVRKYLKRLPD